MSEKLTFTRTVVILLRLLRSKEAQMKRTSPCPLWSRSICTGFTSQFRALQHTEQTILSCELDDGSNTLFIAFLKINLIKVSKKLWIKNLFCTVPTATVINLLYVVFIYIPFSSPMLPGKRQKCSVVYHTCKGPGAA